MKVYITETARENLGEIHAWHADYDPEYADAYHRQLIDFLLTTLADNPKIGRLYNAKRGVRRMVFDGRFNIYYQVEDDMLSVLFIISGRMMLNTDLEDPDVELPSKR